MVLVFGCRVGIWISDACFQGFWVQFQLGRKENPGNFTKRRAKAIMEIIG
jgi:hypothetical protein